MARVTRSSKNKEAAEAETAAVTPKIHRADIPIRSIENHEAPSKEAAEKTDVPSRSLTKRRNRTREYKKKRKQNLIAAINISGKPSAERNALKANVYKPFKTKSDHAKKVAELQQLTMAQQHEIAVLKKQLAKNETNETSTPKTKGTRRLRNGFK